MLNIDHKNLPKILNQIEEISPNIGLQKNEVETITNHLQSMAIQNQQNKQQNDDNSMLEDDNEGGNSAHNLGQMEAYSDDDLVFDELGNIYLMKDVILNILSNYKKQQGHSEQQDDNEMKD
eukprot:403354511